MVKLKRLELGDTLKTFKWTTPFTVELVYKGFVVAINRKQAKNPIFLFIKTYTNEVFYGSSRFLKYGMTTKKEIRDYIDGIIRKEFTFDYDNCTSVEYMFEEGAFQQNERRDQIRYE